MVSGLLVSPSNRDRAHDPVAAPLDVAVDALVKGAQDGDSASFAALYEHFYDKILRYVSFKTGNSNESEDIAEDVFLKMLESIGSFRWQGHPFSSWLFRIAHNLVVDHFRKRGRRKQGATGRCLRPGRSDVTGHRQPVGREGRPVQGAGRDV